MAEQRYKAVMAVISVGRTVKEAARDWGVSRQTLHAWLARYEKEGFTPAPLPALERCQSRTALLFAPAGIGECVRAIRDCRVGSRGSLTIAPDDGRQVPPRFSHQSPKPTELGG